MRCFLLRPAASIRASSRLSHLHGIGHHIKFPWAPEIKAVAIIPEFEVPTHKARAVLPLQYPRQDVVSIFRRIPSFFPPSPLSFY